MSLCAWVGSISRLLLRVRLWWTPDDSPVYVSKAFSAEGLERSCNVPCCAWSDSIEIEVVKRREPFLLDCEGGDNSLSCCAGVTGWDDGEKVVGLTDEVGI